MGIQPRPKISQKNIGELNLVFTQFLTLIIIPDVKHKNHQNIARQKRPRLKQKKILLYNAIFVYKHFKNQVYPPKEKKNTKHNFFQFSPHFSEFFPLFPLPLLNVKL